ncbi:cytochrome P450 [Salipaludibacillus daqingensis]|uniref:cytochrome P450 n=1 Tax=Salipaludibacillus daqingensis TaxID=3041001 RepID=UPI002475BAFA|nr:cytochrome P450 [Salipaludibacillus daqingensis]
MSRTKTIKRSRIKNYFDFRRDPLSFFVRLLQKGDIVSLNTGLVPSYIVNSPSFVQEILVTKDAFFRKGRTSKVLTRTIGDGLLTTEKSTHKKQKKYFQPVFYKERLMRYADTMVSDSESLVAELEQKDSCLLDEEMMELTLSIISKVMFATNVDEKKKELAAAVSATIKQTANNLFSPILLPLAVPTKGNRTHRDAINKLENVIYPIIDEAKRNPTAYEDTMVGLLLDSAKQPDAPPISDKELRDQMMTMLLAGHETSANLLTWIFYALSKNPEAEAKFHEEIDQLDSLTETPFETYRKLTYTNQIIKETLRLYPPAWLIYREADEDVELLGETYKAGSTFMIAPYSIHRNADIFPDPEQFKPERFSEENQESIPTFAYFPFGAGSRSCIGYRFAMMETALILAVVGKSLRFERVDAAPVEPEPLVSLRVKDGLNMKVVSRKTN